MYLEAFQFHLRSRNLAPSTIKVANETLRLFLATNDPLTTTRNDLQRYLGAMQQRCRPSTVWTAWRHLKAFFGWLEAEGDITTNPMAGIPKPIVPPTEVDVLTAEQVRTLLATCQGRKREDRRDNALLCIMLDTGMRLSEVTALTVEDIGTDASLRIFGKGRKWRTVALGERSSLALMRWLRIRGQQPGGLFTGRKGPLCAGGIRRIVERRGAEAGLSLHPHMLRHTFVDLWLRSGGNEVDLARLCGWTSIRMAELYARQRADERALSAHSNIRPLDGLL
jgi:integrase/recombinase XerC